MPVNPYANTSGIAPPPPAQIAQQDWLRLGQPAGAGNFGGPPGTYAGSGMGLRSPGGLPPGMWAAIHAGAPGWQRDLRAFKSGQAPQLTDLLGRGMGQGMAQPGGMGIGPTGPFHPGQTGGGYAPNFAPTNPMPPVVQQGPPAFNPIGSQPGFTAGSPMGAIGYQPGMNPWANAGGFRGRRFGV